MSSSTYVKKSPGREEYRSKREVVESSYSSKGRDLERTRVTPEGPLSGSKSFVYEKTTTVTPPESRIDYVRTSQVDNRPPGSPTRVSERRYERETREYNPEYSSGVSGQKRQTTVTVTRSRSNSRDREDSAHTPTKARRVEQRITTYQGSAERPADVRNSIDRDARRVTYDDSLPVKIEEYSSRRTSDVRPSGGNIVSTTYERSSGNKSRPNGNGNYTSVRHTIENQYSPSKERSPERRSKL